MRRRQWLATAASALPFGLLLAWGVAPAKAIGGVLPDLDKLAPSFDLDGVAPPQGRLHHGGLSAKGDASPIPVRLRSADFQGRWLVLYFYPKDFTSGCTLEARSFQAALADFQRLNADVVGISADAAEAHVSFCAAEGLTYPLLSDPGGSVSRAYGSWLAPYSQRHTFLIDPNGQLRSRWLGVRPLGHGQEVLAELQRLQQQEASPG
jgi:peroxiredoxin Q/BCP